MKELIQQHGFAVSIALMIIILVIAAYGYFYIKSQKKNDKLLDHRGIIEMWPSLVSTLGVLGTFAGITMGLYYFDTNDLTNSIPLLLSGLKTAFFTSLAGMAGSLVLSGQVNKLFDEKTGGVSDSAEAAGIVVKALETLNNKYKNKKQELIGVQHRQINIANNVHVHRAWEGSTKLTRMALSKKNNKTID